MYTKEQKNNKFCCFYVSDFHLEMILLPYINEKITKENFVVITEHGLKESISILLNKINIKEDQKSKILNINWENNILNINNLNKKNIIINGGEKYIKKINSQIEISPLDYKTIIDCYNIEQLDTNMENIKKKYDGFLNTGLL